MRLHQLSITAFGPFAETVDVDFDALAASGLFLLTGATGAGKSSVLDAVCFALYGQVPGDRAHAKHLQSDHASPGQEPRVVLELSIEGRRFRFTRSPAWSRPKRRGTGTTAIPAHVLVEEQVDGAWTARTNRLDEAGHLIGDLLGMSGSQFTQVAMLPQGRFQAFLRATSAERHAVLQQLFRTDRFERVEKWLAERRTADRRASEAAADAVLAIVHRLEEASTAERSWGDDLALAAADGQVQAWSADLAAQAQVAAETALAALTTGTETELGARGALADARAREALVLRARAALADLDALDADATAYAEAGARLQRHRRAAVLAPLATRVDVADDAHRRAVVAWSARKEAAVDPAKADLIGLRRHAAAALATAEAFLPRERELDTLDRRQRQTTAARVQLAAAIDAAEASRAALPADLAAAEARREQSAASVARLSGLRAEVVRLRELSEVAERVVPITLALDEARADLRDATVVMLAAKEHHLHVWEARIKGMAAELAGALVSGCECPVCGSADHPAPARVESGAVDRTEEAEARRAAEDAAFSEQNHQVKVAGLTSDLAALGERLGGQDRATLTSALTVAEAELAEVTELAAAAEDTSAAVIALRERSASVQAELEALRMRASVLATEFDERETALAALRAERDALLDGQAADVAALVAAHTSAVAELDQALTDFDAAALAKKASDEAIASLREAALEAGFADAADALDALLDQDEAGRLDQLLAVAESRRIAARATLDDPEVRAAVEAGAPEVTALAAIHDEAATALQEAVTRADATRRRARRLTELDQSLGAQLDTWAPLRERYRLSAEVAALVDGTGRDNPLKMRLAAYVLAERLRQVVAAANERLSRMTGDRYALEHVADRGVGELRGGLSLRVRDDWSGVHRDPATLSGGETFVVSLALALGLADTVAHEAGGTDIDTLFVDEGFGSLDPDTLEDVMDTLDALRDSGRVVGVVSHVPELRNRITTQLEVVKGLNGPSTLRTVLARN